MKSLLLIFLVLLSLPSYGQFNYQKEWSTYYFGERTFSMASALDTAGNVIVVGQISPYIVQTFPAQYESSSYYDQWATSGSYKPVFEVNEYNYEGYVTKFKADGSIEWSTYFGGINSDSVTDVAVDSSNNIYIVGTTDSSSGIATPGAYISDYSTIALLPDPLITSNPIGFLAKFSPAGALQWSTYIPLVPAYFNGIGGTSSLGTTSSLTVGANDMVYVYGRTIAANTNLIVTPGAFQETFYTYPTTDAVQNPNKNGFIMQFDEQGNKIAGTFCGSSIYPSAITTDNDGNVLIVGDQAADTPETIASANSYQPIRNGGEEGFISKFTADLTNRIWSTYYGDTVDDGLLLVTTAGTDIYLHGRCATLGTGILATAGAYSQTTSYGYLAKFTGAGAWAWGTYLPFIPNAGTGVNAVYSMAVNNDKLYIAGPMRQTSGISTSGAYQSTLASPGYTDGYMMQFTTGGMRNWGTYFGGNKADYINAIEVVDDNTFYVYGFTNSSTGISTPTSIQPMVNYGSAVVTDTTPFDLYSTPTNMFLAKFSNPLSTPSISRNSVQLTPNPSNGQFVLSGYLQEQYDNLQLKLYDSLGKEVAQQGLQPMSNEIHQVFDFSSLLSQGIYFAKLSTGQEVLQTFKVVVK